MLGKKATAVFLGKKAVEAPLRFGESANVEDINHQQVAGPQHGVAHQRGAVLVAAGVEDLFRYRIDAGETPPDAALRELAEEAGTDQVEIVAESESWLTYEFPDELRDRVWGGRYAGQTQRWFLMRFTGEDSDIDVAASEPAEFGAWRWMRLDDLVRGIVAFKRPVYDRIAAEFGAAIRRASDPA